MLTFSFICIQYNKWYFSINVSLQIAAHLHYLCTTFAVSRRCKILNKNGMSTYTNTGKNLGGNISRNYLCTMWNKQILYCRKSLQIKITRATDIWIYYIKNVFAYRYIYKWVDWIISSMIKFPINLRIRYLLFIKKFMSLGLNLSAMRIIMTYILFLILFFVTVFGFPAAYWWYYKTIIDIFIEHVALRKCRAMYSTGRFFA